MIRAPYLLGEAHVHDASQGGDPEQEPHALDEKEEEGSPGDRGEAEPHHAVGR